jgi:hypothetical protein
MKEERSDRLQAISPLCGSNLIYGKKFATGNEHVTGFLFCTDENHPAVFYYLRCSS